MRRFGNMSYRLLAVVIALFLWVVARGSSSVERGFDIPVVLQGVPDDLVVVDPLGQKVSGRRNVSTEIAMHLFIYRNRPDVGAVVHAHPPTATGFAAAGIPLDSALCSEIIITLGTVPLANYETPGTPELAEALAPLVGGHDAILMANHGVVTYGVDLHTAYMNMETVEHFAKIALVTHLLGKQHPLSDQHVDKLREMRVKYRNHVEVGKGKE